MRTSKPINCLDADSFSGHASWEGGGPWSWATWEPVGRAAWRGAVGELRGWALAPLRARGAVTSPAPAGRAEPRTHGPRLCGDTGGAAWTLRAARPRFHGVAPCPARERASDSCGGLRSLLGRGSPSPGLPRCSSERTLQQNVPVPPGNRDTSVLSGPVSQRAGGLIGEAVAPPAGRLGPVREPAGSTCGLISSPTWESAHSLNERGKEKNQNKTKHSSQMPSRASPPDLHGGSRFGDCDSAPTRCALCSCGPEARGTDVPQEPCASDSLRPSLFHLPLLLSSSFLLPKPLTCFSHFSPAFLSLLPSSLLSLCFIILEVDPSSGDRSWTLSPIE